MQHASLRAKQASLESRLSSVCWLALTSERTTSTPVVIHLEAAREKFTGHADFTIDLVIDVDTCVGLVTFSDTTAIEAPIHASFRPRIYTLVENAIP